MRVFALLAILLLPAILTAQTFTLPCFLNLQGNDKIQTERIQIQITENNATITYQNKVLTHRIIKTQTGQNEQVYTLSCGGRLKLDLIKSQLQSFSFSCPSVTLFSSMAFCEAVEVGRYKIK